MARPDPIQSAQQTINEGGIVLFQTLPLLVLDILEKDCWRARVDANKRPFRDFPAFVEHPQWEGLGIRYDDLRRFCKDRPDVLSALEGAYGKARGPGGGAPEGNRNAVPRPCDQNNVYRINVESTPTPRKGSNGTSRSYLLRRLRRDHPELFERVVAQEMTPRAAAKEAGIVRDSLQVTDANPAGVARRICERFGADFARELRDALDEALQ